MPDNISLMEKPTLNLVAAKKIIAAAEAEAVKQGWPVVIAIVDDGGHLINLERLDNAQFASVEVAIQKARAAVAFKRPTLEWEKMLTDGQPRVLNLPGVLASEGGVPLVWKGLIVGAIGVSGVKPSEDGQVARAGASVLE
ncbi:MAG TPA: heme-binding protein [Sulfuricaulis sp.]